MHDIASRPLAHLDTAAAPSSTAPSPLASWQRATKRYGNTLALDSLDLDLRAGEVTALLGPNGAGKTTAVRLLLGLTRPTSGTVTTFGANPRVSTTRQRIGAMLQVARVPDTLTVEENIRLFSAYYPCPVLLEEVLALVDLADQRRRRFGDLSGGQRQRLLFGLAVCGNPELLVLDEPTVGLDVDARRGVWAAITATRSRGCAVLLTTHYLEEADVLADRVVMLHRGRVVADGTPATVKAGPRSRDVRCRTRLLVSDLADLPGVREVLAGPPRARLVCDDSDAAVRALLRADASAGDIEVRSASLEDAFLALTGTHNGAAETAERSVR